MDPTLPDLVVLGPQNILFPERPNKYFITYKVSKKIHESRDMPSSNEMQANMTRLVYY